MLVGSFRHTIDEKNRLSIPSVWREYLEKDGKGLYVTRGVEQCLFIFSSHQFDETIKKIQQQQTPTFLRIFCQGTSPLLDFDRQGRILVPQLLKDLAKIGHEALLIGMVSRIEVWNPKQWDRFCSSKEKSYEESAESIFF